MSGFRSLAELAGRGEAPTGESGGRPFRVSQRVWRPEPADHDLWMTTQRLDLRSRRSSVKNSDASDSGELREHANLGINLDREFSGGRHIKGQWARVRRFDEPLKVAHSLHPPDGLGSIGSNVARKIDTKEGRKNTT